MKKSTIITIFIIYLASIVAVGFFGFKVKVIGEVMYVKTINLDVRCEDESAYEFREMFEEEKTSDGKYNEYVMFIDFSKAQNVKVEDGGEEVNKKQLAFSIIPSVIYRTGDSPDAEEDTVVYSIIEDRVKDNGYAEIDEKGVLTVWEDKLSFTVKVSPKSTVLHGSEAIIEIYFD